MKKIFQLLVVLLLFMQPMTIFAKAKQLTSTITWELKKDGTLIISGTGKMPDMDRDKYPWAKKAQKITSVKIGEGITYISKSSFSNYRAEEKKSYQITTISLPSTLSEIAYEAFRANKINSLVIPNSVVKIDNYAFSNNMISVLYIPSSLKVISAGVFQYNTISSLTIPEGVVEVGSTAFKGNKLKVLSIPSSLTKIGYAAFANNNIASLEIPNNITEIVGCEAFAYCGIKSLTLNGKIWYIPEGAFKGNKITSLVIPEGVTNVGDNAFQNCGITTLSLPSSLRTIGKYAFAENNITNVKIPEGVKEIGDFAFFKALPSYATLEVANSVKSIGDFAFGWKNSKYASDCEYFEGTILNLPAIVTEKNYADIGIDYSAFNEYSPTCSALVNKAFDWWYKKNNWEKARECYERCLTDPRVRGVRLDDKAHCAFMIGRYYESEKDYHNALKYYEKAQYLGMDDDAVERNIKWVKWEIETQVNDSLEIKYRDAVQEALRKNNYALAFDYYVKLYKILRCKTEELHSIPKYFEDKKDYATAIKYYKEVYEVQDKSLWAANHIAELYLNIKDYEGAVEWASIHAQRGDKEGQYKLAQVYEKAKNKNLAIFWYKKAAEQKHLKAEEALAHYGIYINTQHNTASSQQTTQTSSSQSKASSSNSQSNSYTPEYGLRDVWVPCWACNGSGDCPHCHGIGQYISTRGDGSFNSVDKCMPCYGNGKCQICMGTRGHYEKQQYQIR